MNKAKLMFFVSCPQCKRKFGIEPRYISMYLARIITNYKERFGKISEMLEAAQADIVAGRNAAPGAPAAQKPPEQVPA